MKRLTLLTLLGVLTFAPAALAPPMPGHVFYRPGSSFRAPPPWTPEMIAQMRDEQRRDVYAIPREPQRPIAPRVPR